MLATAPAFPVPAAVYEVGPAREIKQLAAVASRLNPGDTVRVDGGSTYAAVTFTRSGTRERPIVILGLRGPDGKRALIPFRPGIADLADGRITADPAFLA